MERAAGAPDIGGGGAGGGAAGPPPQEGPTQPIVQDESCFNQNPCCATWASQGGCRRDTARMDIVCSASCNACKPQTYTLQD
ncbi:unnamed protein product, partial [Strongylus vulgaris]